MALKTPKPKAPNLDGQGRRDLERPAPREEFRPADPRVKEVIRMLIAKLGVAPERPKAKPRYPAPAPVTEGHGNSCVCEICYFKRVAKLPVFQREPGDDTAAERAA